APKGPPSSLARHDAFASSWHNPKAPAEPDVRKCCNFENGNGGSPREELSGGVLGRQFEQPVDELILSANIVAADPPRLPLPHHVYGLISCKRSPRGVEHAKALLGLHAAFDRTVVLLQDVIQILDRSMAAAAA